MFAECYFQGLWIYFRVKKIRVGIVMNDKCSSSSNLSMPVSLYEAPV